MAAKGKGSSAPAAIPAQLSLAKISPPRMPGAAPRPRLFGLLNELSQSPAVWIHGAPGAGKSTLVATYLAARGFKPIWYQVDSDDADPGSFFMHLIEATQRALKHKSINLLRFSSEFQGREADYARLLFRALMPRLSSPTCFVFDNLQQLDVGWLWDVLGVLVEELHPSSLVFLVSQTSPPAPFSGLLVKRTLSILREVELRFSLDEAQTLMPALQAAPDVVARLQQMTDGWAAGLTLAYEYVKSANSIAGIPDEARQVIFDYFTHELLRRIPPETRRFLQHTALLPNFTESLAVELTGNSAARSILEQLVRRHFFTQRLPGEPPTYQYHGLFQSHLQHSLQDELTDGEWDALNLRVAQLLSQYGQIEAATRLYLRLDRWSDACELLQSQAEMLLHQGRRQTLQDLITSIPRAELDNAPWLGYWMGVACIHADEAQARTWLNAAHEAFEVQNNAKGKLLSAAAMLEAYSAQVSDLNGLTEWLARLRRASQLCTEKLSVREELHALSGRISAAILSDGTDANDLAVDAQASRLLALLLPGMDGVDPNDQMVAARSLLEYFDQEGKLEEAGQLIAQVRPIGLDARVSPLILGRWFISLGYSYHFTGQLVRRAEAWDAATDIARRYSLVHLQVKALVARTRVLLGADDLHGAKASIQALDELSTKNSLAEIADQGLIKCRYHLLANEAETAQRAIDTALAAAARAGFPATLTRLHQVEKSACLIAQRHYLEAERLLRLLTRGQSGAQLAAIEAMACLAKSLHEKDKGPKRFAAHLQQGFALIRESRVYGFWRSLPRVVAALCDDALALGIETETVKAIIRSRSLPPPEFPSETWPWRLKLLCLGKFEMLREDGPVRFSGKAQKKPLELLKILAVTVRDAIDASWVAEQLWPEAAGDAARLNFDVTVSRLRKLLDIDNAIQLTDGKIRLNRDVVWSDVWAMDKVLANPETSPVDPEWTVLIRPWKVRVRC